MPWRSTPARRPAHRRIRKFWDHAALDVIEANSTHRKPFNVCAARNNAVKAATTDVVILADADTLPDLGAVFQAVDSLKPGMVIWPYHTYRHIGAHLVDETDLLAATPDRVYRNSVGGCFVCHRETYWALGGMDERFVGWGFDDNAWALVAQTLGVMTRIPGVIFSFNHAGHRDMTDTNPNKALYDEYLAAANNQTAMRSLITR